MNPDIAYLLKVEGETIPVSGNLTIGRHVDNDVIVAGEDVLDFHLRMELHERGPELIPLGNATYSLNGRETEAALGVIPGDVIGVGAVTIQIGVERETTDGIRAWVLQDDDSERVYDVPTDMLIGRHPECGLQIDSEHVSRRHARLLQVAGALWIQDLASANGTAVNRRAIRGGCRLLHGDEIRFDEIGFRLRGIGDDLTELRPFRDEDLRPIRQPDVSTGPGSESPDLLAKIESSLEKRSAQSRSVATGGSVSTSRPVLPVEAPPGAPNHQKNGMPTLLEGASAGITGRRFPLQFGRSRIGSSHLCEIRIEHAGLADVHAEIVMRPEGITLTALGGAGDCAVNGRSVVVHDLKDGDHLVLRDTELIFREAKSAAPRPRRAMLAIGIMVIVVVVVIVGGLLS
jgi:pSer/pThr/pTyr-binding forkhead associated (FHA) protein